MRHESKKLSVIIVNWNTKELLKNCLSSFIHNQYPFQLETIVVDNASTDGSAGMVQQQFPTVKLIQNTRNLGFAKANNIALQSTTADYFILLNSDTIAKNNAFTELFRFMEKHPEAGVVGPKLLNSDGTLQYSCTTFPDLWAIFFRESGLSGRFPKHRWFGKWFLTWWDHQSTREVDTVSGACFLLRKQVYDVVGGLDERFFMYTEEVDWCYRIKKTGWKIYYSPGVEVMHLAGGSDHTGTATFEMYKSWYKYRMKHFGKAYTFAFIIVVSALMSLRIGLNWVRKIANKDTEESERKIKFYQKVIGYYFTAFVKE